MVHDSFLLQSDFFDVLFHRFCKDFTKRQTMEYCSSKNRAGLWEGQLVPLIMQHGPSYQLSVCGLGTNIPQHTPLTAQVLAIPLLDVGRIKAQQPLLSVTATPSENSYKYTSFKEKHTPIVAMTLIFNKRGTSWEQAFITIYFKSGELERVLTPSTTLGTFTPTETLFQINLKLS